MNLLNLYANGNLLILGSHPMTTSGSVNYDTCAFNFNSDWKGFARTAVFAVGDSICFAVELDDTGVCKIPRDCLKKTGVLKIGVVGENDEGIVISTNVVTQRIVEGANNSETDFIPVNPDTGDKDETTSNESAMHLLWQDNSFRLEDDFIFDDYSAVDETDIHSVYNVLFSRLVEEYPTYVTANVEGQDNSGNDIMSFTFTGSDYDRVILITANHFASSYMALRALGGFFKNLCRNYKTDANLNFLHSKVKFVVLPIVCPEALLNKSRCNSNGVAPFVNYDYLFEDSPIEDKGDCIFSEPETIPVISSIDNVFNERCVWYFDLECGDFAERGKQIYYKANDATQANFIFETASKFDSKLNVNEHYVVTSFVESNAPIATNYATNMYGMGACTILWSEADNTPFYKDKYTRQFIDFLGTFLLEAAKKSFDYLVPAPKLVTKHFVWHGDKSSDYISLSSSIMPMWVSGYSQVVLGKYNVTVNGFVTVDSDVETKVRVRPVLYQIDSKTADYEMRFRGGDFDVEATAVNGVCVLPFSSVISAKPSNMHKPDGDKELCFVVAAASGSPVKITGITYTLNMIPSDGRNSVEVLSPIGLASDYTEENTSPIFEINYPETYYDEI